VAGQVDGGVAGIVARGAAMRVAIEVNGGNDEVVTRRTDRGFVGLIFEGFSIEMDVLVAEVDSGE
jgi:hypothetical protein